MICFFAVYEDFYGLDSINSSINSLEKSCFSSNEQNLGSNGFNSLPSYTQFWNRFERNDYDPACIQQQDDDSDSGNVIFDFKASIKTFDCWPSASASGSASGWSQQECMQTSDCMNGSEAVMLSKWTLAQQEGFIPARIRRRKATQMECVFCKNNGEDDDKYKGHILKDPEGRILCPILRAYDCPVCHNGGGDKAHTLRYCPLNRAGYHAKVNQYLMQNESHESDDDEQRVNVVNVVRSARRSRKKGKNKFQNKKQMTINEASV